MNEERRERLPVSVSAAVFIDRDGKLLLLQQAAEWKGNKWGPPAGGAHAHEDPRMTAIRETEEEIGIRAELTGLVGVYTTDRGDAASGVAFVFKGKINDGEVIKIRPGEIMNYKFFTPEEIQELIEKGLIYKPEYNLPAIKDWLGGQTYSLEIIKSLSS